MKLAYFSPLRPQRSGMSDYSEELLPYLVAGAEIDLFVDGFQPSSKSLRQAHRRFDYQNTPVVLQRLRAYDAVLYQMGNDHRYHLGIYQTACAYPGIVVLHDYALHTFFRGLANASPNMRLYRDELAACADLVPHPVAAPTQLPAALNATQPPAFQSPLNCRIARTAEALIVHSEWSRARLSHIAPAVPIAHINHQVLPADDVKANAPPDNNKDRGIELVPFGYVRQEHAIEKTATAYLDFIREVIEQRARRRFVRRVSAELAYLDPEQTNDIFLRGVAAEIAQLTPA